MKLKVVTPDRVVLETEDVEAVYAQTVDGDVGILPRHIPMVTPLAIDVLRFVKQGQKEQIAIMGGILRTNGKEVSVLADAAELATEIDLVRAQQAKERAEARLRQLNSTVDEGRAKLAMTRALTRIRLKQTKP